MPHAIRAADRNPNVVLIFADDLGYGDLGCYGATKVQTPNMDRLAKEGLRFTDAHSASAVCTPSRYGLLTGEYPFRAKDGKGLWGPCNHFQSLLINTDKLTLGQLFKNKGYATAAIGKWHLGFGTGRTDWNKPLRPGPLELGFDYYFGIPKVNSGYPYVYVENDGIVGYDPSDPLVFKQPYSKTTTYPPEAGRKSENRVGGAKTAHAIYDDEKTGTLLAEKAVRWITEKKDNPFFLYFPTPNIHHPFTPAPRFRDTSQCGLYGDFVHEFDWMVGEILNCLDDNGLSDNTLVIFTSDNGGMLNHTGRTAMQAGHRINGDLLGFKFGVWEGGHRVPFIAKWPGRIKPGTTSTQLISCVDMLATFAALTGQTVGKEQLADSINMLPALLGEPSSPLRDTLVLCPNKPSHLAVRKGKWMYIPKRGSGGFSGGKPTDHAWGGPPAVQFAGSVNSDIEGGKYKSDAPEAQLYDLEQDLAQTTNVYRENPQVVKEMETLLSSYRPTKTAVPGQGRPRKERPRKQASRPVPGARAESAATPPAVPVSLITPSNRCALHADAPKPNFVVIFTDDLGYADLSCYGGTHVTTPRIDQMAAEGARLTSFYVAASVCTPSRAALMTGCYPKRIDMATGSNFGVLLAADTKGLNPEEITIAEVLQSAGYKTGMFGKWHLGDQPEFLPTRQGFDEYFGLPYSHDIHPFHTNNKKYHFPPLPLLEMETVIELDPNADFLTKRITERAVAFIEKHKDTPFFTYVPHPIPHRPLHASPAFMKDVAPAIKDELTREGEGVDYRTRDKLYRQAVAEIDWSVGQILDALKKNGLDDNTVVIFTSDNGPRIGSARPLKGGKGSTFEGGMRMPTVIRWPSKIPAGIVNDELLTAMDLLPTFARLAGAEIPSDRVIDGKDVWPVLTGKAKSPHEAFFYHRGKTLEAVRSGSWKLRVRNGKPTVLYHLDDDIGEKTNVLADHPEIAERLRGYMREFEEELATNSRPAAFVDNARPLSK
jgi:arylsulfatase A-like enzyme